MIIAVLVPGAGRDAVHLAVHTRMGYATSSLPRGLVEAPTLAIPTAAAGCAVRRATQPRASIMDAKTGANIKSGKLTVDEKDWSFPIYEGTIGPSVLDISKLYAEAGMFTYDPGYTSTGSCESKITYIDGDEGILLYRGYPIEQLAEHGDFLETCYLLLYGELPTAGMASQHSIGQPFIYPKSELDYATNFLRMCFAVPCEDYKPNAVLARAMDRIFILHADHEQNASTSTVRLAGSPGANPLACI